jgi:DNA-binding transcriptional ArsR family regulator
MIEPKINKRLKRLAESGICSFERASEYAGELKALADKGMRQEDAETKSKVFKALADPTRLRILGLLSAREMCVCEVMVALDLTQPTTSHHLGILENVGLVKKRKEGKWVFYRIANPFESLSKTLFNEFVQQ